MKNTKIWRKISYWKKVIFGQEVYFPRQVKVKNDWVGSQYGGFYVVRNYFTIVWS